MSTLDPDPLMPRAVERGMTITLLGPLAGAGIMFVLVFFIEGMWTEAANDPSWIWRGILLYLMFGWPSGLLPALASAIVWLGIERHVRKPSTRSLVATAIGGFFGATLIWPFIWLLAGNYAPNYWFAIPAAAAGAGALLATARPWRVRIAKATAP